MLAQFLRRVALRAVRGRLASATKPAAPTVLAGTLADLTRSKTGLLAENTFLRQQLIVLTRSVKRPRCTSADRAPLVFLARRVRGWRQALLLVQPDTLLRWHRQRFRPMWRRKSRPGSAARRPTVPPETIALIRAMAAANVLWGAERIRGELLKLDIRVAKWTVQQYLRHHAPDIWACDILPVTGPLFRQVDACFVGALASRRVLHVGVIRHPTDAWVAQQLRAATSFDQRLRSLIRDNDRKDGQAFTRVAEGSGSTVLRTADRAPRQNATCERFLGGVRRACLDHVLVLGEAHLRRILREYATSCNTARPHQGLQQRIPGAGTAIRLRWPEPGRTVRAIPVLGGLHPTYQRAA